MERRCSLCSPTSPRRVKPSLTSVTADVTAPSSAWPHSCTATVRSSFARAFAERRGAPATTRSVASTSSAVVTAGSRRRAASSAASLATLASCAPVSPTVAASTASICKSSATCWRNPHRPVHTSVRSTQAR